MNVVLKRSVTVVLALIMVLSCVVVSSAATSSLKVSVGNAVVNFGESFNVDVAITENAGIACLRLFVDYDETILTLTGVEDKGLLNGGTMSNSYRKGYKLVWLDALANKDNTAVGTIATLQFKVNEDIDEEVSTNINVYTQNANDILNKDLEQVSLSATAGKVTIEKKIFFDAVDPWISIRGESYKGEKYVSAGIRFKASVSDALKSEALEIGYIVAPQKAIASLDGWYEFDSNGVVKANTEIGNKTAIHMACYDANNDIDIVYKRDTANGKTHYQMILTGLSKPSGENILSLSVTTIMYVKTADGYSYYLVGTKSYKEVLAIYDEQGIELPTT